MSTKHGTHKHEETRECQQSTEHTNTERLSTKHGAHKHGETVSTKHGAHKHGETVSTKHGAHKHGETMSTKQRLTFDELDDVNVISVGD